MSAADFELRIDGHAPVTDISLTGYERSYDAPAKVTFKFGGDWRAPPYGGDRKVELFHGDGDDRVRLFEGLLNEAANEVLADNHRALTYEAVDRRDLAARLFPKNSRGEQSFALQSRRLGAVVAEWLAETDVQRCFDEAGIDPEVLFSDGADAIECFPVSLSNASLDSGLAEIARSAPGVGLLLDCSIEDDSTRPRYRFVNAYGATVHDLAVDTANLGKLQISSSIEGRGGAVQTLAGSTVGSSAEIVLELRGALTPGWDQTTVDEDGKTLEQRWSAVEAAKVDETDKRISPIGLVYRLFSFAELAALPTPGTPVVVEKLVFRDPETPTIEKWKAVEIARVDWDNKTVLLKRPALRTTGNGGRHGFNFLEMGRVAGKSAEIRIGYSTRQSGRAEIAIPSLRYPAVGYAGRVAGLYPVRGRTVVNVTVPGGVDRTRWVAFAFAQLSEPEYRGEIPIVGSPPADLLGLGRRINLVSAAAGRTGYEDLRAPLKGIRVEFRDDNVLSATLQLSRDTTELLKDKA